MKLSLTKKEKKKLMEQLEKQENESDIMIEILNGCEKDCKQKKEAKHAS